MITLGTVATATLMTKLSVLSVIAVVMTIGVYGLVGMIVKIDDLGLYLTEQSTSFKTNYRSRPISFCSYFDEITFNRGHYCNVFSGWRDY